VITPIAVVDAFTDRPFAGNPAGVCLLDEFPPDEWMQSVAAEMRHAETAFLVPREPGSWDLRWFTPTVEVDLCGHATLASGHVLFAKDASLAVATFHTRSGPLKATRRGARIELDFPAEAPSPASLPEALPFLGPTRWTGRNRMDWFVQLATAAEVRALVPDLAAIARLGMRGLLVTAPGEEGFDFVSRCFFPQSGVDEDPVTGSAHCAFAPYWSEKLGRTSLRGYQASARGGEVAVERIGDRVRLVGSAVTVLEGTLQC
jgi:predicted PhzF superfamily epimerase YddE/YHI9